METPVKQVNNSGKWLPGQSGNPQGRPKKGMTLTGIARDFLGGSMEGSEKTRKEVLIEKVFDLANKGSLPAIKLLWSYTDGLPIHRQEITEMTEEKDTNDWKQNKYLSAEDKKLMNDIILRTMLKRYSEPKKNTQVGI